MDISMPGISGIEVASALKRLGNKAKIVFLTCHEDSDIVAASLAAGGLGYVVKILMNSDLIPAINGVVAVYSCPGSLLCETEPGGEPQSFTSARMLRRHSFSIERVIHLLDPCEVGLTVE
jgi:DNA-binding NarL/FixJ family response regulator